MKKLLFMAWLMACIGCSKEVPLVDLGQVPEWTATNQQGEAFGSATLAGKPYAVNFMFTSCPSACPPLAKASQDLQTRIKAWSPQTPYEAHIVTISVDPETDTPEKLAQFGATYQADNALWKMARLSSYREMEDLVTKGFYLPIMRRDLMKATNEEERLALLKQPTPLDTAHGVDFMLVDRDGHIRGRYKKDAQGLDQLNAALKHLAGQ